MKMKISIIIPIYNVEKYLDRCLKSVTSQTFQDFECILINDCSTDKSWEICNNFTKFDKRFKVIHNKHNEGSSLARKTGLNNSKGDYILFVDSDDWIEPDMVEKMYNKAISDNCDIVYCDFVRFSNSGENLVSNIDVTKMAKNDIIKNIFSYKFPWNIWNKLIKRELFDNILFPVLGNTFICIVSDVLSAGITALLSCDTSAALYAALPAVFSAEFSAVSHVIFSCVFSVAVSMLFLNRLEVLLVIRGLPFRLNHAKHSCMRRVLVSFCVDGL